jgi:hypothetical protein
MNCAIVLIICVRIKIGKGECKDKVLVVVTASILAVSKVLNRGTTDQLASGTTISTLNAFRTSSKMGISALSFHNVTLISGRVVSRHLIQGIQTPLL